MAFYALRSDACRWECLHSQMNVALVSYGAKPYTFHIFFYFILEFCSNKI